MTTLDGPAMETELKNTLLDQLVANIAVLDGERVDAPDDRRGRIDCQLRRLRAARRALTGAGRGPLRAQECPPVELLREIYARS